MPDTYGTIATDPKRGLTLAELARIIRTAARGGMNTNATVHATIGARGQIKALHITGTNPKDANQ